MKSFETHGGDDTIALGRRLAHELPQRGLVLLVGNLGAGKTTLLERTLAAVGEELGIGMLAARGTSVLRNIYSINRGYEDLVSRLNKLGAKISFLVE